MRIIKIKMKFKIKFIFFDYYKKNIIFRFLFFLNLYIREKLLSELYR